MSVSLMTEVHFSVLGPVEAHRDGAALALGRPKQRAVLALLLAEPGRPVSMDRILDAVWGEEASEANRASVHTYISNRQDSSRNRTLHPGVPSRTSGRLCHRRRLGRPSR